MIKRLLRLDYNVKSIYLLINNPVIRENGDYFTVILGMFKLFVWLKYYKLLAT